MPKCLIYKIGKNGGSALLEEVPGELRSRVEVLLKFEKYLLKENLFKTNIISSSKNYNGFPIFTKKFIVTEKAFALKLSNKNTQVSLIQFKVKKDDILRQHQNFNRRILL